MEKEIIVALIAEDIRHNQLLNGLESIGLTDNDRYTLSLDLVIAKLMGFGSGTIPDAWMDTYHKTMLSVPCDWTTKEAHRQAIILFESLSTIRPE